MRKIKSQKAFTLIELLVVVSIIGVISGIILVSMQGVRGSARDARRVSDMNAIVKAIQLYYDKTGQLPPPDPSNCCNGWNQAPCGTNTFISALTAEGILTNVPSDPSPDPVSNGNGCAGYEYARFLPSDPDYAGDPTRGAYFVLGIINMETTDGTYSTSPGFVTDDGNGHVHNWQDNFEWVTGGYQTDF